MLFTIFWHQVPVGCYTNPSNTQQVNSDLQAVNLYGIFSAWRGECWNSSNTQQANSGPMGQIALAPIHNGFHLRAVPAGDEGINGQACVAEGEKGGVHGVAISAFYLSFQTVAPTARVHHWQGPQMNANETIARKLWPVDISRNRRLIVRKFSQWVLGDLPRPRQQRPTTIQC
jgi:hypothetical protein